jgi:nicotinamidase-related amidase
VSSVGHEGFHGRAGFGRRPALLVIDVNVGFTDPASPLVCKLDGVVAAIARLLDEARRAQIPVVYTTVSYTEGDKTAAAAFIDKVPALLTLEAGSRWVEIDPRIAPLPHEPVLNKLFASAFFGTALSSLLAAAGCDSVIVTGASTSGCVRATAVDALQHGYRPLVPREAVGDRNPAAHEANLYDIDAKYGDVVSVDEAVAHLAELAGTHAPETIHEAAERAAPR